MKNNKLSLFLLIISPVLLVGCNSNSSSDANNSTSPSASTSDSEEVTPTIEDFGKDTTNVNSADATVTDYTNKNGVAHYSKSGSTWSRSGSIDGDDISSYLNQFEGYLNMTPQQAYQTLSAAYTTTYAFADSNHLLKMTSVYNYSTTGMTMSSTMYVDYDNYGLLKRFRTEQSTTNISTSTTTSTWVNIVLQYQNA